MLSLGGGAILDPDTRADLAGQTVVFLDVSLGEAAKRVGLGVARPLLLGNVRTQLRNLMEARRPLYDEVAKLTVVDRRARRRSSRRRDPRRSSEPDG